MRQSAIYRKGTIGANAMAVSKKELMSTYGRETPEGVVIVCPHCVDGDNQPTEQFTTLEAWKEHMQRQHGGYTSSEVAAGQPAGAEGGEPRGATPAPPTPTRPKRVSQRTRELNDKLNRCISLVFKHMSAGLDDSERKEMEDARTTITEAFIGIEFDFEERLVSLSGKWAVLIALVLLYTLPLVPPIGPAIKEKIREKRESHA